jgi:hypothetical protein
MAVTDRQKKIVNPYASTFDTDGRKGVGYDYEDQQNRFVLDAIHEKYLYFLEFPQVGTLLRGFRRQNRRITEDDMLAYFALYPQNGKLVDGQPSEITNNESIDTLRTLAASLEQDSLLSNYSSRTTELTYEEEYVDDIAANLIAIPPEHSKQYREKLRFALNLPNVSYNNDVDSQLDILEKNPEIAVYVSSDSNIDLYDWTNNGLPSENNDRVYYNPADRNYYYVKRTSATDNSSYSYNELRSLAKKQNTEEPLQEAIAVWSLYTQERKDRYINSVHNALREILKLTSRNSEENFNILSEIFVPPQSYTNVDRRLKAEDCFPLMTFKDLRPGSRWVYAVKIDSSIISDLEAAPIDLTSADLRPSFEEYELSSLSKSQRLISDQNKSFTSISFRVLDMVRYLLPVRNSLRFVGSRLQEEGLTPEYIDGIDLEREATRIESFFELLELFYSYNKLSLDDEDLVEFFFTDEFLIDHIVINGQFYYQGCGMNNYIDTRQESTRVVNAFSLFTPTTFSILRYSYEIYNDARTRVETLQIDPLDFLDKYIFPVQDLDALKVKRQNSISRNNRIEQKRKNIFTRLSEKSKNNSPEQFEKLFQTRSNQYRISSTLQAINCDTGQAKTAKYALKIYAAATSKTRWRSIMREAIIILRQELIENEYARRALDSAERGRLAPDAIKAVERYVNSEIFCSLDLLGDYIEDNFLNPSGAPPETSTLVRKTLGQVPSISFSIDKPISLKVRSSEIYRKAVETIVLNFIKSLVAGIVKDLINALLGCGPNSGRDLTERLRTPGIVSQFGTSKLPEAIFNISYEEAAERVSLVNVENETIDGETRQIRSAATSEQLIPFVDDVSKMCTPVELQRLLDGDAQYDLIQHILETVAGASIIQDYNINPLRYNTLNFTNEKIKNFFIILGDNTSDFGVEEGDINSFNSSPLDAYCDTGQGSIPQEDLLLDPVQLEQQYSQIVESKINKINTLCNALSDFSNIDAELQRLFQSIPDMSLYDDFLQNLAEISNGIASSVSELFTDILGKDQQKTVRRQTDYNLYCSDLGTSLFFQIFLPLRELPINQFYNNGQFDGFLTPAGWNDQRSRFGYRQAGDGVEFIGSFGSRGNRFTDPDITEFIWQDNRDPRNEEGGRIIEPPRVPLPQYRPYQQASYESWDSAYYSLNNAPESLKKRLSSNPSRTTVDQLNRIKYGSAVRDADEQLYLSSVANRVYQFMTAEELGSPYIGWTGATFLACGAPGFPSDSITVSFFGPNSNEEIVAEYNPQDAISTERSSSLYYPRDRGDFRQTDYRIFSGLETDEHNVLYNDNADLVVDGVQIPPNRSGQIRNIYKNFSIGVASSEYDRFDRRRRSGSRDSDVIAIQNYRARNDSLINAAIITDQGKRRFPRYVGALNKTLFTKFDDVCITAEDIAKADAAIQVIQVRLASFFLNVMPLASSYPNWGSVGTVKLISDYLYRRVEADLRKKEILGSFFSLIESIELVYPNLENDLRYKNNPVISNFFSPKQNLKNIVEAVYLGMLENIQDSSEYSELRKSIFDPTSVSYQRYRNTLYKFYTTVIGTQLRGDFGITEQSRQDVENKFSEFIDIEAGEVTELGMLVGSYYFPVAFQIASYLIYYDMGIKYSSRYEPTNYRSLLNIAGADDSLLTAIKDQPITKFTETFSGFPTSVESWQQERNITYYSSTQVEQRIEELNNLINNFGGAENNSYGLNLLANLYQQDNATTVSSLYESYFSNDENGIVFVNNRVQYRTRQWRPLLRTTTISIIDDWFSNWSGPDEPSISESNQQRIDILNTEITQLQILINAIPPGLPGSRAQRQRLQSQIDEKINLIEQLRQQDLQSFNYNRTLEASEERVEDLQLSEEERNAERSWINILENDYKDLEVSILTPTSYFTALSEYFRQVAVYFALTFENARQEYRQENPGQIEPDPIRAYEQAQIFFTYLASLYETAPEVIVRVLEEKNQLESLINTND